MCRQADAESKKSNDILSQILFMFMMCIILFIQLNLVSETHLRNTPGIRTIDEEIGLNLPPVPVPHNHEAKCVQY